MSHGPTRDVAEGVRAAASAGVELSRLQARLFWLEAQSAKRQLIWYGGGLGFGIAAGMYAIPLIVVGAAVLLGPQMGLSPAASVLLAGCVLLLVGAITSVLAYQMARRTPWFPRSMKELRRNLDALWPRD